MKPKSGIAIMLGVGPKPQGGPPPFGGAKRTAYTPSAGGDAASTADDTAEEQGEAELTPDMLSYHGADANCGSCKHFTAPSTCDRWTDPVEEGAWCRGWQGGGASDMAQETPAAEPAAMESES